MWLARWSGDPGYAARSLGGYVRGLVALAVLGAALAFARGMAAVRVCGARAVYGAKLRLEPL